MEAYGLIEELQLLAVANGWFCIVGSSDSANAELIQKYQNTKIEDEQLLLWIDDSYTPTRGIAGSLESIPYIASINLLRKRETAGTQSTLDETIAQKRTSRVKELTQLLSDTLNTFICSNNLSITSETLTPVYNLFDLNLDGITGNVTLVQTYFDENDTTVDLILTSEANGTTIPVPDTYSLAKYSHKAIYGNPDDGYESDGFTVNGVNSPDNPISVYMNKGKTVIAKFITLGLIQKFLTGTADVVNLALIDHSINATNAKIMGGYLDGNSVTSFLPILDPIAMNLTTEGLKYEFITSLGIGQSESILNSNEKSWAYGVRVNVVNLYIAISAVGDIVKYITFPSLAFDADDIFWRIKFVVDNNQIMTAYKTIPSDSTYTDVGLQSATFDLKTLTGIRILNEENIGGANNRLKGKLKLARILDHVWTFEDGSLGETIFSSTSQNSLSLGGFASLLNNYTNDECFSKDGYTTVFYEQSGFKVQTISYYDGSSNIVNVLAEMAARGWAVNAAYEEHANGEFEGNGWGFACDASIEAYDVDNTYFDVSSNANVITANKQPTKLADKMYYDRENDQLIELYEAAKVKTRPYNTVGKILLVIGDSTTSYNWADILAYKLGMTVVRTNYSGETTAEILVSLMAEVITTPTLISQAGAIVVLCAFNDYNAPANTSEAQLTIDYDALIDYIDIEKTTGVPIVCDGIYNFGNPIDDGSTPNANGLTMNQIRAIQENTATLTDNYYSNLNDASLIQSELDGIGVHPVATTGNLKIANENLDTFNTII